ncbi:MAG: 50S ribosomal protein L29 [Candidatus Schekmanbacteria bacterium]|nr:50S ribosomal protein L29 [Candidatus Schekmanbacteria bacterium]
MANEDKTRARDLRERTQEELALTLEDLVEEHFNLRVKASTGQIESPSRLRTVRRAIARVKTVQRMRELERRS